jgi:hypothetical protein
MAKKGDEGRGVMVGPANIFGNKTVRDIYRIVLKPPGRRGRVRREASKQVGNGQAENGQVRASEERREGGHHPSSRNKERIFLLRQEGRFNTSCAP